jgi:hypothetical protein
LANYSFVISDTLSQSDNNHLNRLLILDIEDTITIRDSLKKAIKVIIRDTTSRSDSFSRGGHLGLTDHLTYSDVCTVDVQERDFYGQFVITKSTDVDIPTKFTLESFNVTKDFYSQFYIQDTSFGSFNAKFVLSTTKTRFTRNPMLIPGAPVVSGNGRFIEDSIRITINPITPSGSTLNWSVNINTPSTAVFTLDKLVVRMVGGHKVSPESTGVLPKRQYIWDRKLKSYLVGQQYGDTRYNSWVPTSGGGTFSGQFDHLPSGKHQLFVEAIQRGTGNRYLSASGFSYGSFPYTVHASGVPNYGLQPKTINFSSARGDGSSMGTSRIIWYYDFDTIGQWKDISVGRSNSYTYRQPNLYIPMVQYVMADEVTVTEALPRVYEEER